MTQTERAKFVEHFFTTECVSLLQTKGKEYSRMETDVNSNFKRIGSEMSLDPKKVLYIYWKKHLDAITNYINKGKVESEPIEKRIADAINYLFILASLIHEETMNMPMKNDTIYDGNAYERCNYYDGAAQCKLYFQHKGDHKF